LLVVSLRSQTDLTTGEEWNHYVGPPITRLKTLKIWSLDFPFLGPCEQRQSVLKKDPIFRKFRF